MENLTLSTVPFVRNLQRFYKIISQKVGQLDGISDRLVWPLDRLVHCAFGNNGCFCLGGFAYILQKMGGRVVSFLFSPAIVSLGVFLKFMLA